jgi:hypothetical protein
MISNDAKKKKAKKPKTYMGGIYNVHLSDNIQNQYVLHINMYLKRQCGSFWGK